MTRSLMPLLIAGLVTTALACGVPEQKYKAALAETDKAVKEGDSQRQRADACDAKLGETTKRAAELSQRLAELEKAVSAASADAAQQRELASQLAKTRETLEAEKARLVAEKTAASLDADEQRKLASKLAEEKTALAKKSAEYESLASSLDGEIKAGRIQLSELQGKVTVRMAEKVLFPSGSATVSRDGKATLAKIADAFKNVKGRMIRVEGHTDTVPIKTVRFPSNWELSSARAIAVVRILQDEGVDPTLLGAAGYSQYQPIAVPIKTARFPSNWELSSARAIAVVRILQDNGVDPTLLGAAGYSQYQPIAPNDTSAGRAQNRRIEVSLAAPLSALPTTAGAGGR